MPRIMFRWLLLLTVALAAPVETMFAQGTPTGTLSGRVSDPDKFALPGVTVTASSRVLQGQRTIVSSENGDYIIPFLPPGDYEVQFEMSGFQPRKERVRIQIGETARLDIALAIAALTENVTVSARTEGQFSQGAAVATTFRADLIEKLPVGRTIAAAVLLTPGVNSNGPGGNISISGALSFESLFLVNGVVVNENLRGQPRAVYIEDAVQESRISTGSISAEYGRFAGGVTNVITKSGGNDVSGSFRTTFNNDGWRALSPHPDDQTIDQVVPTYELTAGGPVKRDRLWFFGAARLENRKENQTLRYTNVNYTYGNDEKRYEGKLTYALTPGHTVKGAYTKVTMDRTNQVFGTVMDTASFYDRQDPESLTSLNYTGTLSNTFFLEAQYSRREMTFVGSGSQFTDLVRGTPIWDRSRSDARWNSPTFCAVCGSGKEERDNQNVLLKATYFLSTRRTGSHNFVTGVDLFQEGRKNNNYQSGSAFRVRATNTIMRDGVLYPVFRNDRTTWIYWTPIFDDSIGNDLRTVSAFINDEWRLNDRINFNLGVRFDKNDAKDSLGVPVAKDQAFSPRLSAAWDVRGDGKWVAKTGFARYVTSVNTNIADAASSGGRSATFIYDYLGPEINPDLSSDSPVPVDIALHTLFNWFNTNGGTDRATRSAPSVPGLTSRIDDRLISPSVNEFTAGLGRALGQRGSLRADFIYRKFQDFYVDRRDLSTGRVEDATGRQFDQLVVTNSNEARRNYKGINTQASYRVSDRIDLGGNYTLAWARGNFTGETSSSGPDRGTFLDYPEYRDASWNAPIGWTSNDQRHKVNLWASYELPLGERFGRLQTSVMQRVDSGTPYSLAGNVDPRPYVTNPGYLTPPSSVTYFFSERGALRTDTVHRTNLALNWTRPLPFSGRSQLFVRAIVNNLFNNSALEVRNSLVLTRNDDSTLQAFNPFTQTPVRGTHYQLGPDFGAATGVTDYQAPRSFNVSVGLRF